MRIQITLFVGIISILLAACGGDPGGHNPYDGIWTLTFGSITPPTGPAGSTATCSIPPASITLANGAGTATPIENCTYTTPASGVVATSTSNLATAVNLSGITVQAIVNGSTYSGKCISQNGCSAQETTGAGTFTMIR